MEEMNKEFQQLHQKYFPRLKQAGMEGDMEEMEQIESEYAEDFMRVVCRYIMD